MMHQASCKDLHVSCITHVASSMQNQQAGKAVIQQAGAMWSEKANR